MFKKYTKNFSYLCLVIFFISCSSLTPYKVPVLQGNLFEEKDIDKLSAGLTKEQVQFILGTALIKDPFHSQRWDYYYSVKVGTEILSERKISILYLSRSIFNEDIKNLQKEGNNIEFIKINSFIITFLFI